MTQAQPFAAEDKFAPLDPLYTISEVAEYLNVSKATVYRLLNDGSLKGVRVGQGLRFTQTNITDFLATCEVDNAM